MPTPPRIRPVTAIYAIAVCGARSYGGTLTLTVRGVPLRAPLDNGSVLETVADAAAYLVGPGVHVRSVHEVGTNRTFYPKKDDDL